jgi:hypothetical protein
MLNKDENRLLIFDNFEIDRNLPKYQGESNTHGILTTLSGSSWNAMMPSGITTSSFMMGGVDVIAKLNEPPRPLLIEWFIKLFKRTPKPKYTVQQFFKSVKNSTEELGSIERRLAGYEEMLISAIDAGQTAFAERIKANIEVVRTETQLFAKGLTTVITEEQIIDFYKDSVKGIRLDWVKNFTRIIPSEIIKTKKSLDELCVFDNYVIMHYDPMAKSYQMTLEEIEREKDPILFGVIKGSNKLYFVGDWEDEVCDLTLDKLVSKFGEDAIKQNDLTVNINIK